MCALYTVYPSRKRFHDGQEQPIKHLTHKCASPVCLTCYQHLTKLLTKLQSSSAGHCSDDGLKLYLLHKITQPKYHQKRPVNKVFQIIIGSNDRLCLLPFLSTGFCLQGQVCFQGTFENVWRKKMHSRVGEVSHSRLIDAWHLAKARTTIEKSESCITDKLSCMCKNSGFCEPEQIRLRIIFQ